MNFAHLIVIKKQVKTEFFTNDLFGIKKGFKFKSQQRILTQTLTLIIQLSNVYPILKSHTKH